MVFKRSPNLVDADVEGNDDKIVLLALEIL